MRPINYMKSVHCPVLRVADDGFGNLIDTPSDAFDFNWMPRMLNLAALPPTRLETLRPDAFSR